MNASTFSTRSTLPNNSSTMKHLPLFYSAQHNEARFLHLITQLKFLLCIAVKADKTGTAEDQNH